MIVDRDWGGIRIDMIQDIVLQNSVWYKNIEALRVRDAELAVQLVQTPLDRDRFKVQWSPDGDPVLGLRQSDGRFLGLDDAQSPQQKAQEWLFQIKNLDRQNGHIMIVGICTGYHARTIFENSRENTFLWLVEPDLMLLKAAFHLTDLTRLIQSPRVRFVSGVSPERTAAMPFSGVTGNRMRAQGIQIQCTPAARKIHQRYFQSLMAAVQAVARMEAMKVKTMETQGRYVLHNSVQNLPAILQGTPFLRLLSAAPGYPAIVVGPGPSLEDHLERIKSIQDRVLILAVDTALRSLHRAGILSDIIVSVDFSDLNARHFEGVSPEGSILIASPAVHPSITQQYVGRTYFFTHHATRLIHSLHSLGALGVIHVLGSTAHAAYRVAREMGCWPIILVGIDLSFPGDRFYAQGAIQNELPLPQETEASMIEILANDGCMVKTSLQYKRFLDALAQIVQETHGHVITTSLRGALIPGCSFQPFEKVVAGLSEKNIDKSFLRKRTHGTLSRKREALQEELQDLLVRFARFERDLETLIQRANEQVPSVENQAENQGGNWGNVVEDFYSLQRQDYRCFALCTPLCPRATIFLFGATDLLDGTTPRDINQRIQWKQNVMAAFSDFKSALTQTTRTIRTGLELLSQWD